MDAIHIARLPAPEGSGVVASRRFPGVFWAQQDSGRGDRTMLWAFKVEAGQITPLRDGQIFVPFPIWSGGIINHDWEDIAISGSHDPAGKGVIHIGDFGNNGLRRRNLEIQRVAEPNPYIDTSAGLLSTKKISYPREGMPARLISYNAEAMLTAAGREYVIAKKAPAPHLYKVGEGREMVMEGLLGTPKGGWGQRRVTAADRSRDRKRIVVTVHGGDFYVYAHGGSADLSLGLLAPPRWAGVYVRAGQRSQVEAVAFVGDSYDLLFLSESGSVTFLPAAGYGG
ncbi:MAG: hypothetical protein M3467_08980 [Actinomycetota bacterium]|nr:hypothetical protein [Actinomycetota bacterium]